MKIVIVGFGSIGHRYVKFLMKNSSHTLWLFRSQKSGKGNEFNLQEIYSWKQCRELKPDVIFITNPTSLHISTAMKATACLCPLFIEKPLGSSLTGLSKLIHVIQEKHIPTYVAYVFRFHPVIEALQKYIRTNTFLSMRVICSSYLPLWRPGKNWKQTYSAKTSMGGGVLLDLSHELDYVTYLLGEIAEIVGFQKRVSDITFDSEDVADILCETKKGLANIHLDYFGQMKKRSITVYFKEMTVCADLLTGVIEEWKNERCIQKNTLKFDLSELYEKQLTYFLENLHNTAMNNSVAKATPLLQKIISFKKRGIYET